ncbi:MAG: matrixin family metalloprotease [Methylobacterium sp.]|uniref:matrixin family metalloprotease n=1 Tax=Methylobacterium sp. TaxID=409 RepID=UPI0025E54574|nr:matrixin family metalloprotease [Methylobacterium sp.]MBX9930154.1 matrixin family metalloprotease [Methylobacterium sp.]
MPAYTLFGQRWDYGDAIANVTWAVDSTIPSFFTSDIANAFLSWSTYANISFQRVAPGAGAEITFSNASIDGASNVLAWASTSYTLGRDPEYVRGSVRFDADEGWRVSGNDVQSARGVDFYLVALHEIGHAIGIDHSTAAKMVMNPTINTNLYGLTQHDIQAAQAVYGSRMGAPAFDAATGFSASPTPAAIPISPPTGASIPSTPVVPTAVSPPLEDLTDPVFRFYDTNTQDHFYTASAVERDQIMRTIPHYAYEGVAFEVPDDGAGTIDVFRFYNTATQAHFFTSSEAERDQVIRTLPTYQYEGVAFQAFASAAGTPDALVLDRFFNTQSKMHHYSNGSESIGILAGKAGPGWVLEGPSFIVAQIGSDGRPAEAVHEDGVYEAGPPASLNPFDHHDTYEGVLLI